MNIKQTIITATVALTMVAMIAPVNVGAQTATIAQLQAMIAQLTAQLSQLSGGSTASTMTPGSVPAACTGITFSRNLTVGSVGSDVKCLQAVLNTSASTQVATTGAGSPGMETMTFGPRTLVAVKKFQSANGLTPAAQVGPLTRAKLNAWLGGSVSPVNPANPGNPVVVTPTGSISATLAADNPPAGALVCGEARGGLLNINFTGTGTVTSVTLQRGGISTSSTLTNVYLFDGNTRLTSGYSFNTNGQLIMNGLNIAVNGSHEIQVLGDVASGTCTSTASSISATLTGYTANGSTMSSNVTGNMQTVVTGSGATANFPNGLTATPAATTINPGATNQNIMVTKPQHWNTSCFAFKYDS